MTKKFIQEQKEKLILEKEKLEKAIGEFAKKDPNIEGNWNSKFPEFDGMESGGSRLEVAQDEVEEYLKRLPMEESLELRLKDISAALKRVSKGKYGKCEKCKKNISMERLKVFPSARFCVKCK